MIKIPERMNRGWEGRHEPTLDTIGRQARVRALSRLLQVRWETKMAFGTAVEPTRYLILRYLVATCTFTHLLVPISFKFRRVSQNSRARVFCLW